MTYSPLPHRLLVLLWVFTLIAIGFLTYRGQGQPTGRGLAGVAHSSGMHLVFAAAVAAALATSRNWRSDVRAVEDSGSPSKRSLAVVLPVAVLAQVILGAAYRHEVTGVIPHIIGAMLVAVIVLYTGIVLLQDFPEERQFRRTSFHLIGIVSVQVLLGILAYVVRLLMADGAHSPWLVLLTVAHVVVGALTLSAGVTASMQIFQHVRRPARVPPTRAVVNS
jgi:heme A synthase